MTIYSFSESSSSIRFNSFKTLFSSFFFFASESRRCASKSCKSSSDSPSSTLLLSAGVTDKVRDLLRDVDLVCVVLCEVSRVEPCAVLCRERPLRLALGVAPGVAPGVALGVALGVAGRGGGYIAGSLVIYRF